MRGQKKHTLVGCGGAGCCQSMQRWLCCCSRGFFAYALVPMLRWVRLGRGPGSSAACGVHVDNTIARDGHVNSGKQSFFEFFISQRFLNLGTSIKRLRIRDRCRRTCFCVVKHRGGYVVVVYCIPFSVPTEGVQTQSGRPPAFHGVK